MLFVMHFALHLFIHVCSSAVSTDEHEMYKNREIVIYNKCIPSSWLNKYPPLCLFYVNLRSSNPDLCQAKSGVLLGAPTC